MRAKEFIKEAKFKGTPGKMSQDVSDALPGVFVQKDLRNTDPYMQYRYALAVAAARANKEHGVHFDQESSWSENLTQVMYTPEDEETIKLASKLMGVKATRIADNSSHENKSIGAVSPVAKSKPNKYGV